MTQSLEINSVSDLRKVLSETIQGIRDKTLTPKDGNSIARASGVLLASVRIEMEYCRMVGANPTIPFINSANGPKKIEPKGGGDKGGGTET